MFTKRVIELFDLFLVEINNDIYTNKESNPALTIKTHYESLDIAQSKRIHYLQFKLTSPLTNLNDNQLQEILKNEEKAD